jgi:hypothetical protein
MERRNKSSIDVTKGGKQNKKTPDLFGVFIYKEGKD